MKLRDWLNSQADIDLLLALNEKMEDTTDGDFCIASLFGKVEFCDQDCNKCLCELLNSEASKDGVLITPVSSP